MVKSLKTLNVTMIVETIIVKYYSRVIKIYKKNTKFKDKINRLTMDQLVNVPLAILAIDKVDRERAMNTRLVLSGLNQI